MRVGSPKNQCAVYTDALMMARPRSGGAPGTPSAWETPPPARLPRRLTIMGGFRVDDGRYRYLDQQAKRLGFASLRGCLQALLDDGWSIPQLATHLDTTQPAIRRAMAVRRARVGMAGWTCSWPGLDGDPQHSGRMAAASAGAIGSR